MTTFDRRCAAAKNLRKITVFHGQGIETARFFGNSEASSMWMSASRWGVEAERMQWKGILPAGRKTGFARPLVGILPCREIASMAKGSGPMTKSETMAALAETVGITKKQAGAFFEALAELAYKQAKNTFTIPGIGKLVLAQRPPREMVMRFGPKAGQTIKVPAKKVVKFRVAKACKDAILGTAKK